jgi:hypothetical protein
MPPIDWERETEPGPFEDGRYQADWLCNRSTSTVRNALEQASESRRRLRTRLFSRSKCAFLDGFMQRLTEELARRAERGETGSDVPIDAAEPLAPPTPPPSDVLERISIDLDDEARTSRRSRRPIGEGPSFVRQIVPRLLERARLSFRRADRDDLP